MKAIDYIKNSLDDSVIEELLLNSGARGVKKTGREIRCSCPIHKGNNTTAFTWNLENNLWFCFTGNCNGGDIFDFVAQMEDMSIEHNFIQVIKRTAELLNIDISDCVVEERRNNEEKERKKWIQYMLSKINKPYNEEYDLRQLGDLYSLNSYLCFDKEFLKKRGIYYSKYYNRIVFSIHDKDNKLVGASLRRCDENEKIKWLHRPKHLRTGEVLYNYNNIDDSYNFLYLFEGMKDVLKLVLLGVDNVVATFGVNITDGHILLLSKYTDLVLVYDNDNAGKVGTLKAIKHLRKKFNIKIIDLSDINKKDGFEIESLEEFNNLKRYSVFEYLNKYNLTLKDLEDIK